MFGTKLIFDEEFTELNRVTRKMDDYYFRSCTFSGLAMEGGSLGTVMILCEMRDCHLYWTSVLSGLFVKSRFVGTTFQGASFSGSKFIECVFEDCAFTKDNLGGDCDFGDAKFIDCEFLNSTGAPMIA